MTLRMLVGLEDAVSQNAAYVVVLSIAVVGGLMDRWDILLGVYGAAFLVRLVIRAWCVARFHCICRKGR